MNSGFADTAPSTSNEGQAQGTPALRMWDAVSIIVGITVGTAIFRSPTLVFQNTTTAWQALGIWLVGGLLCIAGALCYAELATSYPRNGGDYEYLRRGYGAWAGFLFAWAQLTIVATANIGAMAYAFADYSGQVWPVPPGRTAWIAAAAIVAISLVNLLGLVVGRSFQNLLTSSKVLGLGGLIVAGLLAGGERMPAVAPDPTAIAAPSLGLALVFVLYAFGGWNDAVFVAAEVRHQERDLPRALLLGISAIAVIYLAANAAYLAALGFDGARATATPAADVLAIVAGPWGARVISLLVMISALGAINGMVLAHSRIYATLAEDHRIVGFLGGWSRRRAPIGAIVTQAVVALALVFGVGTPTGRGLVDKAMGVAGLRIPWEAYFGGFETLVAASAPVFWTFFLLTGVAVLVLRKKDAGRVRPFRVPLYPLPVLVFCTTCAAMLYSSLVYARWLALLGLVPIALGVVIFWIDRRTRRTARS